ncbi:hypothetical protein PC120_g17581 [Phytophthora cactorum]|nr:hypothetical protein PC120_g17581 [Phytophthora cactorum]
MGTPKYKGMLQALTQFRDQAAQAIVPQLGPHRKVTSAPTPDTAETTAEPEEDRCGGGVDGIGIEDIGDRIEAPTTNAVVSSDLRLPWVNLACVTLGLLFIKSRHPRIAVISPDFTSQQDPVKRKKWAGAHGAFVEGGNPVCFVAAVHVTDVHWAAFIYYPGGLCSSNVPKEHPESSKPKPSTKKHADGVNCGVLALLFIEMSLAGVPSWGEDALKALNYYRLRYLRHGLALLSSKA